MALIKEYIAKNGASVSYWRVDMISKDRGRRKISFSLMGYVTKEISISHPDAFITSIGADDLLMSEDDALYTEYFDEKGVRFKDIETACYQYAKTHMEFFKDAQDDAEEGSLRTIQNG